MKIKAAVLRHTETNFPYRDSKPLSIETVDLDMPEREEVLIKIMATGLCHSDLVAIDGSRPKPMPIVLGHETVGIIEKCGDGVDDFQVGDTVIPSFVASCGRCDMCRNASPGLCVPASQANATGTLMGGGIRLHKEGQRLFHHSGVSGFAEYAVVSVHSLVKIDDSIPHEHAALFGCGVMTGAGAIINTSNIQAGDSVAIIGVGGVGLSAMMAASTAGAGNIIAIDLNDDKLTNARKFGATHTVNAKDADAIEQVKKITGGGVHIAIESAGVPQALELAFAVTRIRGTTIAAGLPGPERTVSLSHFILGAHERTVKGSYMGSCVPSRDIPKFLTMYEKGQLAIDKLADRTLQLEDINEAFDLMHEGGTLRSVIKF